jgi:predicted O-methyltransferase YrrM
MNEWISHMPFLAKIVDKFKGNTLELGTGMGSSIVLNYLCKDFLLYSYESNREWYEFMKKLNNGNLWNGNSHKIFFVENSDIGWDSIYETVEEKSWKVAFIDHAPGERRKKDIRKLKDIAEIILFHDSEQPGYCYEEVIPLFKYKYIYKEFNTYTTAVSNSINLEEEL